METEAVQQEMLSEFDYFTPTRLQSSITGEYDDCISTTNAIAPNGNALGVFEFTIPGASDLYRDLNNTYIMLQLKVVDAVGGNLAGNALVAPVNLLLHSLFSNVSVTLCGKEISDKDSLYPYRAYLETLLTYEGDVHQMRTAAEGWAKDQTGRMEHTTIAVQQGQPAPNSGFVARQKIIDGSRQFTLVGRPHLDLFHQDRDIPPGCTIHIKFTPSTPAFALIGDAALNASRMMLMAAKLYVRTKKVAPELILSHKEMLQSTSIRLPLNRVTVQKYGIPLGFTSHSAALNFPAKLPKRVFVAFVTNTASAGAFGENPFNFQNFGITKITLRVNGEPIPTDGLEMNYATGDYQRAYLNTLAALGLDNGNRGISLTPEEFAAGFNIYGFRIAPGPIDGTVFSSSNSVGGLTVDVKFAGALQAAVDMIVFAESPAILEIDTLSTVTFV